MENQQSIDLTQQRGKTTELAEVVKNYLVKDQKTYDGARHVLEAVKLGIKTIKSHYAPLKEQAYKSHKTITTQEKNDLRVLLDIEKQLKTKMLVFVDDNKKEDTLIERGDSVQVREPGDFAIVSESQIPRDYMMPNMALIKSKVQAQGLLAAEIIPGIRVIRKKSMAVKV